MSVAFLFNGNSRFFHLHTLHLCQGVCTWCKVACIVTAKASVRFVSIHQPRKKFCGWFFILRPQRGIDLRKEEILCRPKLHKSFTQMELYLPVECPPGVYRKT